jgi:cellulose synthase/poly-beta-1,6-N-acetylglucosamine synthase-like glycosyltransferase
MSHRNLVILTKIILIYSIFFIVMKAVILFGGAWLLPNLLLMFPFVILGTIAGLQVKRENYSWWFVGTGAAVIILTRIYETRIAFWIQQQIGH